MASSPRTRFLPANDVEWTPGLRAAWQQRLEASSNLYALYQSPEWFEILRDTGAAGLHLGLVEDDHGEIVGVVPVLRNTSVLTAGAAGRDVVNFRLPAVEILGSVPLVEESEQAHRAMFEAILHEFDDAQAVALKSVALDGFAGRFLAGAIPWLQFRDEDARQLYLVRMPATFDEYLERFTKKKRYNLRRQVRLLTEHFEGRLDLVKVTEAADVPRFLEQVEAVDRGSWKHGRVAPSVRNDEGTRALLAAAAERGLLRAYLLCSGEVCCAYALGFQTRGIYHYSDVAFDDAYTRFSAGAVLLFLLLEDLFAIDRPDVVHFGITEAEYKRQFSNDSYLDATVVLLRPSLANRARKALLDGVLAAKSAARGLARRRRSSPRAPTE